MNIIGVQLILMAFGFFMMYVLFLHWKKSNISSKMFFSWMIVWLSFIFFTFFPTVLAPVLQELFIVRVMDLGMIGAFMILTYLTLENNISHKKTEEKIEKVVRYFAKNNNKIKL